MPKPGNVWMVHARTPMAGVKGSLLLQDRTLVFVPEGGRAAETSVPLESITAVRRPRGTPVLEIQIDLRGAPSVIGFYFVEPPPLAQSGSGTRVLDKFLAKRRAVIRLKVGGAAKREEVDHWVVEMRNALTEKGG